MLFNSARYFLQTIFQLLLVSQMSHHQAFPKLPVIRDMKMQQLMHNDVVAELFVETKQLGIKRQVPVGGARCPFVAHGPHGQRVNLHAQLDGPLAHARFEGDLGWF